MAVSTFAMPVRSYCFAGFAHVIMAVARPNWPETGRIAADVKPIEILVAAAVGSRFATATCSVADFESDWSQCSYSWSRTASRAQTGLRAFVPEAVYSVADHYLMRLCIQADWIADL